MITLNQGQKQVVDGFFEFLFTDEKAMIISGEGGSGKSFLASYLINDVMKQYTETCELMGIPTKYTSAVITATTNKAGEILADSIGIPVDTIHSFMNLTMYEDYKTGEVVLTKTRNYAAIRNTIVFIDEYSMVNKKLLKFIDETLIDCKIVYVGDCNQLPPVKEHVTEVQLRGYRMFELTEPVRNAGQPALIQLCKQFINTVKTNSFQGIKLVPEVIVYMTDEQVGEEISTCFLNPDHNNAILAYYNDQVIDLNNSIRTIVRGFPKEYVEGETLICNTAVEYQPNKRLCTEEVVHIVRAGKVDKHFLGIPIQYLDLRYRDGIGYDIPVSLDNAAYSKKLKEFSSKKDWHNYFTLKKIPDLRSSDARTVHKSQGSSYDTVFIDLTNLSKCYDSELAAKLFYVAVSRARNRIVFFGSLHPKYGAILL